MGRKQRTKKGGNMSASELENAIRKLLRRHPKKRWAAKQIGQKLKIKNSKDSIQSALEKLAQQNVAYELNNGKFRLDRNAPQEGGSQSSIGVVDKTRSGSAYIVCEDLDDDVYVAERNVGGALNGDTVRVKWHYSNRRKPEGYIEEIIQRRSESFIGTLRKGENFLVVEPDQNDLEVNIFIERGETMGAKTGDKVVVTIVKWHDGKNIKQPIGQISTVLGRAGSNDIEMKSILINQGFDISFPKEVMEEAEAIPGEITEEEIAQRRDLRDVVTFTIDPTTAKDFDDALSVRVLENGNFEVGIHIADVSHYVQEGSALDKFAAERSTSVYLVDRVLPMLPERLSNELCSLRPEEDKLTFSAIFEMDRKGKVYDEWFGRTVIHSDRRFTYGEAQERIETGEGDFANEIRLLNSMAIALRKKRFREGSMDFDSKELRFELDNEGVPLSVHVKARQASNMLVEDFMLLANRRVASYIYTHAPENQSRIPFVYRVHDTPDVERVAEVARFAEQFGYQLRYDTPQQISQSINSMMKKAQGKPEYDVLQQLSIRSMAKAAYSTENIGHYGLGFDNYTHFTSPIRRYSDVLVHRLLAKNLPGLFFRTKAQELQERCEHISKQERKAITAERESVKYKQVEYLQKHVNEEFDGIISGMMNRGVFVEILENFCEGMIPSERLLPGYRIDTDALVLRNQRSGHVIRFGQKLRIRVVETDLKQRQVTFQMVEPVEN